MGMARKSRELDAMSDSHLQAAYDAEAENTVVGTGYWREEILHRRQMYAAHVQLQQAEQTTQLTKEMRDQSEDVRNLTRELRDMTRTLRTLAFVSVGITVVALVVAVASLLRSAPSL
jgi:type II secretory pathway component PulF